MIPSVPTVLNGLARTLLMDLAPQLTQAYAGQTLQLAAALTMMIAQEHERAAARLVEENTALESLFRDALPVVGAGELAEALQAGLAAQNPSLLVSALTERNRALRALLIRVHEHVEALAGDAARDLEARIWAELVESTRRRQLDLGI